MRTRSMDNELKKPLWPSSTHILTQPKNVSYLNAECVTVREQHDTLPGGNPHRPSQRQRSERHRSSALPPTCRALARSQALSSWLLRKKAVPQQVSQCLSVLLRGSVRCLGPLKNSIHTFQNHLPRWLGTRISSQINKTLRLFYESLFWFQPFLSLTLSQVSAFLARQRRRWGGVLVEVIC